MILILVAILTVVMIITSVVLYSFVYGLAILDFHDVPWYLWMFIPILWILRGIARIIDRSIFGQMIFNFAVSSVIMIFTGAGLYAGAANLIASLIFPLVIKIMKETK